MRLSMLAWRAISRSARLAALDFLHRDLAFAVLAGAAALFTIWLLYQACRRR